MKIRNRQLSLTKNRTTSLNQFPADDYFEPSHLDELYQLVRYLQAKILTKDGEFLEDVTARDLSSLIGAISALLRGFTTHEEKIDHAVEVSHLRYTLSEILSKAPVEFRDEFLRKMDEAPSFEESRRRSHQFWLQRLNV